MKLFKEYKIHSARFLSKLPSDHPCSKMHGHTFFVKLLLSGDPDPENDFIIDFYELDKIFEGHIFAFLTPQSTQPTTLKSLARSLNLDVSMVSRPQPQAWAAV